MPQRLFLSAVTDDYKPTRIWLAGQLRPAGLGVVVQEEFIELGQNTLVKLARSIQTESDIVVHLVGPKAGSVPPADVLATMLSQCGELALRRRFPKLFDSNAHQKVTYTQWESWFALFYGKHLLLCLDTAPTSNAMIHAVADSSSPMPIAEHLALLKAECGYAVTFIDKAELLDKVKSALLRLHNQGTFHEHKPNNLPLATLGELFIGRQPFLDDLGERFRKARAANPHAYPNHLIHGIGGVGKTRTAVEYGLNFSELYTALLFVNGETASDLDRSLSELAGVLSLNLPAETSSPEKLKTVLAWLKAHPGWLLIVDNVDDQKARDAVNGLLKEWHNGHVLITGRYLHWGKDVEPLELSVLAPDDACDFLLKGTEEKRQVQPGDDALAKTIAVEDLGQLCLALEQTSAYIAHREISFAEYRKRWQANARDVRTWADKVLMKYHEEKAVSLSIATTWQTSMDQLSADARRLLAMLSWLSPDPLPKTIFKGIEKAGGLSDTEPLVIELRSFSLLQRATEATFDSPGRVHRLVQLITREQLEVPQESLAAILKAVESVAPEDPDDVRTWQIWNPLQPHLAVVIQYADVAGLAELTSSLMSQLALLFKAKAMYSDAEPLIRRSLAIDEISFGLEHPRVATELNLLALLLDATNRFADAEPLFRRALAIDEKFFGPEHINTARDLNNLATLLRATNRLADVEPLMRRALAIDEKFHGPEHPMVALRLNNLAGFLQDINRLSDAESLRRRALTIDERFFGSEHPRFAAELSNLANLLKETNRLAEAEPLIRRALAIDEKSFGSEHPSVGIRLNNLAQLLQATNRRADAEPLIRRALAIDEKCFGREHPSVAISLNNLAQLLRATSRFTEAEPLIRRALSINEKSFGPEHSGVAIYLNNLASLLLDTNRIADAEPLIRRALKIDERNFGHDHPRVATRLNNLAQLLKATNRFAEAEPLMRRGLEILSLFGPRTGYEHPNLRVGLNNYRELLTALKLDDKEIAQRLAPFLPNI